MKKPAIVLTTAVLFAACSSGPDVDYSELGDIDQVDAVNPSAHSETSRLSVDQLEGSVPVISGGIHWLVPKTVGTGTANAFAQDQLGATLGRPDYIMVMDEPAEANALYVKFMDDMARNMCQQMVLKDQASDTADNRSLVRFAELDDSSNSAAINDNLRYLKLRFLGEYLSPDDDEGVADLKAVFDGTVNIAAQLSSEHSPAMEGWRSVCIALFKAPAFHVY